MEAKDFWLEAAASGPPVSSPSWMAPAPLTSADRVSWSARSRRPPPRTSAVPPTRSSMTPPSIGPRSVVPPAPRAPTAIVDIDELIAPLTGELRAAVASAVASLEETRSEALLGSERALVQLAIAIAERVVGRELRTDPAIVARWAHEGLAALHGEDAVTIVAAPEVAAHLVGTFANAEVTVQVDNDAPAGTCLVRGRWGSVDASLRARLDATIDALEPPDSQDGDLPPAEEETP